MKTRRARAGWGGVLLSCKGRQGSRSGSGRGSHGNGTQRGGAGRGGDMVRSGLWEPRGWPQGPCVRRGWGSKQGDCWDLLEGDGRVVVSPLETKATLGEFLKALYGEKISVVKR